MTVLFTVCVFAQPPQKMSYQAVIRNASNALVTNQAVGIRISILQGSPTGTVVYQELFNPNPQTNVNGLVNIEIGGGVPIAGTFSAINWSAGPYYLKSETDPSGGTNYTIVGTSQILSVPYALYAITSQTASDAVTLTGNQTIDSTKTFNGKIRALGGIGMGMKNIYNLADPINGQDAVTKAYADQMLDSNGKGSLIKYTVLPVNCASVASFTSTYVRAVSIGSFTKVDANSLMEISFHGRISATSVTGTGANFEIRVDDIATTNGRARANIRASETGSSGVPVTIAGIFTGLAAGTHLISIWVAATSGATGTNGGVDPGCWSDDHVIVKEFK